MKTRADCPFAWRLILSLFWIGLFGSPCRADDTPAVKNLLENGGLEGELDPATSLPAGWVVTQKPQSDYKVEVVDGGRTGKKCLRIHGEGKNVQIRLKHLPMNPDQRLVISGWMKVTGGAGTVSLMHQYVDAKGRGLGSMSIGGVNAQQTDWTQTASIDHLQFTRPGMAIDADFIISAGGKIDALVDDLEAFALPVTPKDLLWGMGDFESHFNRSTPSVFKTESSPAGKVETSPDDKRPANGRLCLRIKANADWATAVLRRPVEYEAGKAYTLTGKARVNSGRAGIRIDFYKGGTLTDLLGSSTVAATESKGWQALSVGSPKDVPADTTHITATAVCYGDAEAFLDQLVLLAGSTTDKPEVAAAIAKIEALGGGIERDDDQGGAVVTVNLVGNEQLKDEDLAFLKSLTSLRQLYLGNTSTSDAGLKHIGGLKELRLLGLIGTKVSDAGMKELAELQNLEDLYLANTAVTEEGLKELKESLPNARLSRQDVGQGGGGQRTDPDFDVSIAHPAYTEKHPLVLFDEAHQNFHTAGGRYKAFADLITNDGYQVAPNTDPFTAERLAGHDVLIIANATTDSGTTMSAFSEAECDLVQKWVQDGGSLLLITDHEPFGSASDELGKRFGVEMSLRVAFDPTNESDDGLLFSRDKNQIGDHPVMQGRDESERINRVLTFTGQSLKGPPESVALLKFAETAMERKGRDDEVSAAGRAQGVALKYGRGRVVVMGEAAQLSAQVVGNPPQPMGMNVPGCDNRQMALNLMHWLSGLID